MTEYEIHQVLVFITGLFVGSFLNVVIYRIPIGKSIMFPYSHCTICRHVLNSVDLIPVFSFLAFRRKCRYCGEKISYIYPVIEIITGILFLFCFRKYGVSINFVANSVLIASLLSITMIDIKYYIIPDRITVIIGFSALFISGSLNLLSSNFSYNFLKWISFYDSFFGMIAGIGVFVFLIIISRGGMGFGDAKMAGMMGAVMGLKPVLASIFIAFIMGAIIGSLLLLTGIKGRKDAIPFGPYIAIGGIIVTIFGYQEIFLWYRVILERSIL